VKQISGNDLWRGFSTLRQTDCGKPTKSGKSGGKTMDVQQVFDRIDPEAIARDTLAFVEVQSETGREGDASRFLADLLKREGFDATLDEVAPNRPNVYAFIKGNPRTGADSPPTLMFNGHTDTIPIGKSTPPKRDGDWVVGRGAEDMKGGLMAMVHAASALQQAGVSLAGDLWLTGVIGHETPVGKKEGPNRLITNLKAGTMRADAMIIVEGPSSVWTASLGMGTFTFTIISDRGSIHTIKVPYKENPACWVGRLLTAFEKLEAGFESAGHHPLCGREQINVGKVQAGDYFNRLPTPAIVTGSRRWTPGKTRADVMAEFNALCADLAHGSGLHVSVEMDSYREPFETPVDHPVVSAIKTSVRQVSGRNPEIIGLPLVGDAGLYANEDLLVPVYYGPGYETAHSDNEQVSIERLAHCAKVYAAAMMNYCGVAS